jgi:hypothetical protein
LEEWETKTGTILVDFLRHHIEEKQIPLQIRHIHCESAPEFLEALKSIAAAAHEMGDAPILHVETHGDQHFGLQFANGSELSWEAVSSALLALNIASGFNLLSVFAACYGAYFLSELNAIRPAPCYALVAPTKKVDPGEVLGGFRRFYQNLFATRDAGIAIHRLSKELLSHGRWFGQTAEGWFERIVPNYAKTYSTRHAMRLRARLIYRKLRKAGVHKSVGFLKRQLRHHNRRFFEERAFRTYFSSKSIPENVDRFDGVRQRVKEEILNLRGSRKYFI